MSPSPRLGRLLGRERPLLSVVVAVHDGAEHLAACLDSVLAQDYAPLEVVVVDDGSSDSSVAVAEACAAAHPERVRVLRRPAAGLGAARNAGVEAARGSLLAFAEVDSVVPPGSYTALHRQMRRTGADLVTGSMARQRGGKLIEPAWMRRTHTRQACVVDQHPEILADTFAGTKLFRREFWEGADLVWATGLGHDGSVEDGPTTSRAYIVARRIGVVPDVVQHRRERPAAQRDRSTVADLQDRWRAKRLALSTVEEYGAPKVTEVFRHRVLVADLPDVLADVPGCDDAWWAALRLGVVELWGMHGSLTGSGLAPLDRLVGWLVEQDRREDASAVLTWAAEHPGPLPLRETPHGRVLAIPVLDATSVARSAIALHADER
ncbi:glycosyltransferase family 2 protein [Nocardioides sp. GY 10127]|uniref:glycosyltransferase family 2 protein n=1 Tax=Nocardioides sp. GY 10127 TaxID=2569762 RepID=UPI0010A80530|nr:glycosyltransferase family 2 protein [Nocardioides sp. GY 10127]TIC79397.1 glycosyltransferase family 2 protein [Nocardioides sp. GY 10127]